MASVASSDSNFRKSFVMERRPLMLKDYLRDDLSSCSSNGFKSFPRRKCCTTVRYLVERDLKGRDTKTNMKRRLSRSRSNAASTTISALQRASVAVLNAAKHLPFTAGKSPSLSPSPSLEKHARKGILPRSFSRKLLKRSFWKRTECEIQRWKSFDDLLEEKQKPLDFTLSTTITTTTTTTTASSRATSNSNSWSDSEFTSEYLQSSSGNSECSGENDVVESKKHLPAEKKVSKRVGVAVGEDSMEAATTTPTITCSDQIAKKQWSNGDKEQFSPVSVLDCPFDDEEEEDICSPFQRSLTRMEGTKKKLMQKIRRFENLAQMEPVDLEKRLALSEEDNDSESLESPNHSSSIMSIHDNPIFEETEEEIKTKQKVQKLLQLVKAKIPIPSDSYKFKPDNLLLDLFRERIAGNSSANHELLKVAEDWINGHPRGLSLDWQVEDNRKAYIRDMEEGGRWRKVDEESEEVALEVDVGIWNSLVNDLVFDIFSSN